MRSVVDYTKEQGREARMVRDMMIISGLKYTFDRIGNLPEEVNLTKVFTCEDEEYVYFRSFVEYSSFSSFAPAVFNYKGNKFHNAEQAFTHGKAKENENDNLAKTILQTTDPRKCKQLVANIQTSTAWKNMEEKEMSNIVTEEEHD